MPDYSLGKIYKVVNSENSKVYIGSTVQRLSTRMNCHRHAALTKPSFFYRAMKRVGVKKFEIKLIKEFPCASKAELENEECRIMQKVIKRGVFLYNTITEYGIAPRGNESHSFKRGNVRFQPEYNRWIFQYYPVVGENQRSKSFSVKTYGDVKAKEMAVAYQDMIYPKI